MSTINLFISALDNNHETITVHEPIAIGKVLPDLDFTNSIIAVNGLQTDENHVLCDNDICTIRVFPQGTPGSDPVSIALGVLTLGAYTATDAIVAGVTGNTIAQHTINAFVKAFSPDQTNANSQEALQNIPQLKGAKNQSNKGKPIPLVMGKHLYTPMYIGSPYTTIDGADGEDQYYNVLYLLGWGKLDVRDIRLGPVSGVAKNAAGLTNDFLLYDKTDGFCDPSYADSNPQLELRQGANEVTLYPQKVVEEQLGIQLMNVEGDVNDTPRFTAKNPQKVQVEITFNNGLIAYDTGGNKIDASVDVSVQWRKSSNDSWREFGRFGTDGGQSPTTYNATTCITTITRQKAKVMRFIAERTFAYSEVQDAVDRTLELRIVRETPQPTDTSRTADTVYLTAIRTWCFDNEATITNNNVMVPQVPMIAKYRDQTARLGFRIKASDNLQGTIDALNCVVQSYARTWNGTDWNDSETPTSNPASIALKILQSPALGTNAYPDDMLDLEGTFADFYQWCADRGYTCNGVLTADRRVDDLLNAVLTTGRGMRILDGSRYAILIDKPRANPVMILSSQNVLTVKNHKKWEDLPDGFSIKFVNALDGYQETEVFVMADGSANLGPESKIESIDMPFVTDYQQVIKNGWYLLACRYLRPEVWYRRLSVDAYLIGIGDRVEIQDDSIVVGIGEDAAITGVTIENGYITGIQTDGIFDVTDMSQQYGIEIMQFDGINQEAIRSIPVSIPAPGVYSDFTGFSIPVVQAPLPEKGNIVAFGIYNKVTTSALCFGKKSNGDGTFEVTLIPYQEDIYTTDSGVIPEYEANITTPQRIDPLNTIPPDPLTRDEVIELSKDFAGVPATVYTVQSSVAIIKKDTNGVITPMTISCSQYAITGNGPPTLSQKTLRYITNLHTAEQAYTGPLNVDDKWEYITFRLYDDDGTTLFDFEEVPVLADGKPAMVYDLLPSASVIRINQAGVIEPQAISCAQRSKTGENDPVTSSKTLVYVTSKNANETPYSGAVTIDVSWEWIEFRLYDGTTVLDIERVGILSDGRAATVYDVLPSVPIVRKLSNGVMVPASITCGQQMTVGNNPPISSAKTLVYVSSANTAEVAYSGAITVDPSWTWIEFRLKDGSVVLDSQRVTVVSDGAPGTSFDLLPSVPTIRKDSAGNLNPGTISCEQQVTVGGNAPVPSSKTVKYKPSNAAAEIAYTGAITINQAWEWIEFFLYDGTILLDRERVQILTDGKEGENAVTLDLLNDSKMITCDVDGIPIDGMLPYANKATIYRGQTAINQFTEYPGDIKKRIYSYPSSTSIMSPLPIGMYPVSIQFVTWSIPNAPAGVSIDQEGNITIADGAVLADTNELIIRAAYNGKTYEHIFTVTKMRLAADGVPGIPGKDGVTYFTWLRYADDAQGNGISNSPVGKKYIGLAYNKTSPVESDMPSDYLWSLIKGEDGVDGEPGSNGQSLYTWIRYSDNFDGTNMYQQPKGTTRYIGIAINKPTSVESDNKSDYTWSLFKGDDGSNPIIIQLLDDNKTIACDSFGMPLSLPFATQAYMYQGSDLITDESQYPTLYKKQMVYFPGSGSAIFSPTVGSLYPVNRTTVTWSVQGPAGVSIDQNGRITVAEGAALADENEILVTGTFEGIPYTTTLNITKTYAGEDSLSVELLSDGVVIPCDEYGDPKPDIFPIQNIAAFRIGTSKSAAVPAWSLENAPAGVSINSLGIIRIVYGYDYADMNKITVRGVYNGVVRTTNFTITKVLDGVAPVVLAISPDSETISYDYVGVPKAGQLPATIKATLYKGTVEITDNIWLPRIKRKQIVSYPGSGNMMFSPLATGVYPVSKQAVKWSLSGAPSGVTIDGNGKITIAYNAQLSDSHTITVNAVFDGKTYSKIFSINTKYDSGPVKSIIDIKKKYRTTTTNIKPVLDWNDGGWLLSPPAINSTDKYLWYIERTTYTLGNPTDIIGLQAVYGDQGDPSPRYLGKTSSVGGSTGIVLIAYSANSMGLVQAHKGDWVAYIGTERPDASIWKKGYCIRWTGNAWAQIPMAANGNFETNPYIQAMMDLTENAGTGTFMSLLVRDLIAKTAMIKQLMTKVLILASGGVLKSENFQSGTSGFRIKANGELEANNGTFRGHVEANSGRFQGTIEADDGYFKGELEAGPLISNKPQTTPGPTITYSSGTPVNTIMAAEFSRFGLTTGNASTAIDQFVTGTFNGKQLKRIYIYDQGRAGVGNFSGIKLTFTDDTSSEMYYRNGSLPNALSFAYSTGEWMVKIMNLPGTDPHVVGALWQSAGDVKVSFG